MNYSNPYQQQMNNIFNPVLQQQQQRLMQMEQMYPQFAQPQLVPQQQIQQQALNGRVIDDVNTVNANEVSMDGSIAVFPMRDMSRIYAKRWNQNGVIETVVFEPIIENEVINSTPNEEKLNLGAFNEFTDTLLARIDTLEKKIDSMGVKSTPRVKKESE